MWALLLLLLSSLSTNIICHVQNVNLRVAYLVGASVLAAHSVVLVRLSWMEVEDKHQVPALTHHHLVVLILQSMLALSCM